MTINYEAFVANFPKNIFLVGCGGTGARIAEELKFFMQTAYAISESLATTTVWLVDHDIVEWKNCARQPFVPAHMGYPKSYVKAQYLKQFVRCNHIPEPINNETISSVFTPEILSDNFLVISAVDNKITRSMVYHYLMQHGTKAENKTWLWLFSGGEMKLQNLDTNSILPEAEAASYDLPFVTNLSFGYHKGNPTNTLKPHERFPDEFPDPAGIFGMTAENRIVGCGLRPEDSIRQTYTMNNLASNMAMFMLDRFYTDGLIIDQTTFIDGKMDTVYLGKLDDLGKELTPEVLEQIVSQDQQLLDELFDEYEPNDETQEALREAAAMINQGLADGSIPTDQQLVDELTGDNVVDLASARIAAYYKTGTTRETPEQMLSHLGNIGIPTFEGFSGGVANAEQASIVLPSHLSQAMAESVVAGSGYRGGLNSLDNLEEPRVASAISEDTDFVGFTGEETPLPEEIDTGGPF